MECSGSISMGSMSSTEPITFEKRVLEPIIFWERINENSTDGFENPFFKIFEPINWKSYRHHWNVIYAAVKN